MALDFPTRAERPGHLPHTASLRERALWPEFLYHDPVLERLFGRVIAEYPEFQFYAWDGEREEVVGVGMAVPAWWDGRLRACPTEASTPSSKRASQRELRSRPRSARCRS